MSETAHYRCDRCDAAIGPAGKVRIRDGIVLTALCAACVSAGASLRLQDDPRAHRFKQHE